MSKEAESGNALTRRTLLKSSLGTMSAAAAIALHGAPAAATIKISQSAVAYQDHPDGDKRCGRCRQFVGPASCKVVQGPISPQGYCRIFAPVQQAGRTMRSPTGIG